MIQALWFGKLTTTACGALLKQEQASAYPDNKYASPASSELVAMDYTAVLLLRYNNQTIYS